jgi:hypothetical protein
LQVLPGGEVIQLYLNDFQRSGGIFRLEEKRGAAIGSFEMIVLPNRIINEIARPKGIYLGDFVKRAVTLGLRAENLDLQIKTDTGYEPYRFQKRIKKEPEEVTPNMVA